MAANPPHLTLVDGSGFIFRAYHRLPPLTDPEGTPVGAVFGFTAMLWGLIESARKSAEDDYLAIILDAGRASFRNDIYPEYKANRPPPPEDLVPQFPLIRDATTGSRVHCDAHRYPASSIQRITLPPWTFPPQLTSVGAARNRSTPHGAEVSSS